MTLTREEIVAAIDKRRRAVTPLVVPEWEGEVFVRKLTPAEVDATGMGTERNDEPEMSARFVAACLSHEDGSPMFADSSELEKADLSLIARLFTECVQINGLLKTQLEEAVRSFAEAQQRSSSTS